MFDSSNNNRVKVGVRIRPLSSQEIEQGANTAATISKNNKTVSMSSRSNKFDFDWAFGPNSTQKELYDATCKPLISNIFEGFNATVFAYGQTGNSN